MGRTHNEPQTQIMSEPGAYFWRFEGK